MKARILNKRTEITYYQCGNWLLRKNKGKIESYDTEGDYWIDDSLCGGCKQITKKMVEENFPNVLG